MFSSHLWSSELIGVHAEQVVHVAGGPLCQQLLHLGRKLMGMMIKMVMMIKKVMMIKMDMMIKMVMMIKMDMMIKMVMVIKIRIIIIQLYAASGQDIVGDDDHFGCKTIDHADHNSDVFVHDYHDDDDDKKST